MIDIAIIRNNPERLDAALAKRGKAPQAGKLSMMDSLLRSAQTAHQSLQAAGNDLAKKIGELKRAGASADRELRESAELKAQLEKSGEVIPKITADLGDALVELPNIPADDVPAGRDEADNVEVRRWGTPPTIANPKEHHELGAALGMMSAEIAAKMSGSRFTWLERDLARLERALGQFFLDLHTREFGYAEVSPPILVKAPALFGTGQLPKFEEDRFKAGDHYLIPTAEVSLTNRVADLILTEGELPLRMTALTPCFRSEAGSAGRDTVGMLRQHQFWKVELVSIVAPDQSEAEHERMTNAAETALQRLGLPYRTMLLCAGDMGFSARKTDDLEVWLPGQGKYREISSCSNCGDFQARRMNARCRPNGQKSTQFVHTLNGSGVATGRALIAVMENYQQADDSIAIPDVLQPYMGGQTKIEKAG